MPITRIDTDETRGADGTLVVSHRVVDITSEVVEAAVVDVLAQVLDKLDGPELAKDPAAAIPLLTQAVRLLARHTTKTFTDDPKLAVDIDPALFVSVDVPADVKP